MAATVVAVTLVLPASHARASGSPAGDGGPGDGGFEEGPDGTTLTVGVAVSSDGLTVPSPLSVSPLGDRSLPPLLTYEWDPADSTGSSSVGLEHLCRTDGSDPDALPDGWTYLGVARSTVTGEVVARTTRCVPLPDPADPSPPPPPPTPDPPTIGEVWRTVAIPASAFTTNPPAWSVTGFESWLWPSSPASEVAVAAELDGFRVDGTARLVGWWVEWGDGPPTYVDRTAPADPARHVYERKGTYPLRVHAAWHGEVVLSSPLVAAPIPTDIGFALVATETDHQVIEIVSQLVR